MTTGKTTSVFFAFSILAGCSVNAGQGATGQVVDRQSTQSPPTWSLQIEMPSFDAQLVSNGAAVVTRKLNATEAVQHWFLELSAPVLEENEDVPSRVNYGLNRFQNDGDVFSGQELRATATVDLSTIVSDMLKDAPSWSVCEGEDYSAVEADLTWQTAPGADLADTELENLVIAADVVVDSPITPDQCDTRRLELQADDQSKTKFAQTMKNDFPKHFNTAEIGAGETAQADFTYLASSAQTTSNQTAINLLTAIASSAEDPESPFAAIAGTASNDPGFAAIAATAKEQGIAITSFQDIAATAQEDLGAIAASAAQVNIGKDLANELNSLAATASGDPAWEYELQTINARMNANTLAQADTTEAVEQLEDAKDYVAELEGIAASAGGAPRPMDDIAASAEPAPPAMDPTEQTAQDVLVGCRDELECSPMDDTSTDEPNDFKAWDYQPGYQAPIPGQHHRACFDTVLQQPVHQVCRRVVNADRSSSWQWNTVNWAHRIALDKLRMCGVMPATGTWTREYCGSSTPAP